MIGKVILAERKHENGKYARVTLTEEEIDNISLILSIYNERLMKQCLTDAHNLMTDKGVPCPDHISLDTVVMAQIQIATALFDKIAPKLFTLLASELEQKVFEIKNGKDNGNNRGSALRHLIRNRDETWE